MMNVIIILIIAIIIAIAAVGFVVLRLMERVRKLDQQLAEIVRNKALHP